MKKIICFLIFSLLLPLGVANARYKAISDLALTGLTNPNWVDVRRFADIENGLNALVGEKARLRITKNVTLNNAITAGDYTGLTLIIAADRTMTISLAGAYTFNIDVEPGGQLIISANVTLSGGLKLGESSTIPVVGSVGTETLTLSGTIDVGAYTGFDNLLFAGTPNYRGPPTVATIAALRLVPGNYKQPVTVAGYYVAGDGGGGPQRYYATGAAPATYVDNGGSIVVPTGGDGSEAWLFPSGLSEINVAWFGADNTGVIASDTAFANALAIMVAGSTLVSNQGIYTFNSAVDMTMAERATNITINGLMSFTSTAGVTYSGREGNLYIYQITHTSTGTGIGLNLNNVVKCEIDVKKIENFQTTAQLIGTRSYNSLSGSYASYIRLRDLEAAHAGNDTCFYVTTATDGYVNENYLEIGQMEGAYGIRFVKDGSQTDQFNGNKMLHPQFETITNTGLKLEYAKANTLLYPRFEDNIGTGLTWLIDEETDCSRNDYYLTGAFNEAKFNLTGLLSTVYGAMNDSSGDQVAHLRLGASPNADSVYLSDARTTNTLNNTVYFGKIEGKDLFEYYAGGVKDSSGIEHTFGFLDPYGQYLATSATGAITVPEGTSCIKLATTGAADVSMTMPIQRERNGYGGILLNLTAYTNTLEILKGSSSSVVIDDTEITTTGLYLLVYAEDTWKYSAIGSVLAP